MSISSFLTGILRGKGTFPGGVHPFEGKSLTENKSPEPCPMPSQAFIPVAQHIGAPAKPIVERKAVVKKGQPIAEAGGFVSSPIHSPVCGTVAKVETSSFPAFRPIPTIIIDVDPQADDWWDGLPAPLDPLTATPDDLKARVSWAGIVGLGGATFPTQVKLSPPKGKSIELVVINGAECEPYLTSDYRMMLERPDDLIGGLKILMRIVGAQGGVIAIEDNKPEAIKLLSAKTDSDETLTVRAMPVKYPQGGEKQLIQALTGREVPSGSAGTADSGVLVQNVNTAVAVYDAVVNGRPLIERVVTVTGDGVEKPGNYTTRVGTPLRHLLAHAGLKKGIKHIICGGPMMGLSAGSLDMPVQKGTGGILCLSEHPVFANDPCIRCGACVDACPVGLLPQQYSIMVEAGTFDQLKALNIMDCIECGSCAYSCPSGRPIVASIRFGKSQTGK